MDRDCVQARPNPGEPGKNEAQSQVEKWGAQGCRSFSKYRKFVDGLAQGTEIVGYDYQPFYGVGYDIIAS